MHLAIVSFITGFILFYGYSAQALAEETSINIFYSKEALPITLPSHDFFGSYLVQLQEADLSYFILFAIAAVFFLLFLEEKFTYKIWSRLGKLFLIITNAIFSFKLLLGWDELFTALRHAEQLVVNGKYSWVADGYQEASVEFLGILASAGLALLGLPLMEVYLSLGLVGNLWLILLTWRIFEKITNNSKTIFLATSLVAFFPGILFSSLTGFFSTIFAAAVLNTLYLLYISENKLAFKRGLVLLSLLTLFRVEGIILAFIVWVDLYPRQFLKQKGRLFAFSKEAFITGCLLVAPFILVTAWRYYTFSHIFPNPVTLKNSGLRLDFILSGANYFTRVSGKYVLLEFFIVCACTIILAYKTEPLFKRLIHSAFILFFFTIPYLISGGDWLPELWARYALPLLITLNIIFISSLIISARKFLHYKHFSEPYCLCIYLLLIVAIPRGHLEKAEDFDAFYQQQYNLTRKVNSWMRVNKLGYFGKYLNLTTAQDTKIGTPELSTNIYYAKRDPVDLFGFGSPEVARLKSQPIVAPYAHAIADHRKRNPAVLYKYRPGILAFYEMAFFYRPGTEIKNEEEVIQDAYNKALYLCFKQDRLDFAYFRAGSYAYIEKLGYHYFVVRTQKAVFSYWVHESILAYHTQKLLELGIKKIAKLPIRYNYTESMTQNFSDGMENFR